VVVNPDPDALPQPPALQRRRVERVQNILDAAEALLSEQGYEAATLKAIGERAGIPTASVYHYFANRYEVDAELLQRHLAALDAEIDTGFADPELRTVRHVIDAIIDPYVAYFRKHRSLVELWYVGGSPALSDVVEVSDTSLSLRLWRVLLERKLVRPDTPELVARLAVAAGDRLFDAAFRDSRRGDDATLDEARRLVTAYIETYS